MKEYLISRIRQYQYYEEGVLESKTTKELQKIWNSLIDWIIGKE